MSHADLWAITSYFNPMAYRRRWLNYQTFRRHLNIPLLTVELGYGEAFELGARDATHLIQLRSDQVMWQKERLLNVAWRALPQACRKVVWLDCDLLFERDDWSRLTSDALEELVLVQPFTQVYDLKRDVDPSRPLMDQSVWVRASMGAKYVAGATDASQVSSNMLNAYSPGHAWAMRRDALEGVGLYDGLIVGGADNLMAQAAVGAHEALVEALGLTPMHASHCVNWARQFHRVVNGRVGAVAGNLFHLWHGDLEDRRYSDRQSMLTRGTFDPCRDIAADDNGCWRWSSDKPDLHDSVRAYFHGRREDGG